MKYKIIKLDNHRKLEAVINQMIEDGWIPLGGVTTRIDYFYVQTMTTTNMSPSKWDTF